jgi:hypothetical protein
MPVGLDETVPPTPLVSAKVPDGEVGKVTPTVCAADIVTVHVVPVCDAHAAPDHNNE